MVDRSDPRISFSELLAFAAVLLTLITWLPTITEHLYPLTGDEPFYVMTAISLVRDGDLDERNNYDRRDFDTFYPAFGPTRQGWPSYPDPLPPHATASDRPGIFSKHGLGMALLIAFPWHTGGRTLTLIILAAIAAAVAANMSLLARQVGAPPRIAATVAVLLALTNPLLSFSLLIFPEMTAALCIVYSVRRLIVARNNRWQWLAVGVCAASLPWLHYRLAPISVVLALIAVTRFRTVNSPRDWLTAAATPALSATLLLVWFRHLYGAPFPPSTDHAGFSGLSGTLNGLAGTLLDQQWGAFIHNPLLIVATAAAVPFAIRFRSMAIVLAAVILPYLGLISAYRVWWGEWNPPARYLADVLPLAAAPLAWWLSAIDSRARWLVLILAGLPALAVSATFLVAPQRMYNHPDGTSRLLETWSARLDRDLTQDVPSYVSYALSSVADRIVFTGFIASSVALLALVALALVQRADRPL